MAKKFRIFLLAALLALPLVLFSCGGGKGADSTTPPPEETPAADIFIAKDGEVLFSIIYPEDASDDVKEYVTALYNSIKRHSNNGLVRVGSNYLPKGQENDPEALEILIGDTGFADSDAVFKTLAYGDFTVKFHGNKLVVAGYSRDSLRTALAELAAEIKNSAAEGTIAFPEDMVLHGTTDKTGSQMPGYSAEKIAKTAKEGDNTTLAVVEKTTLDEYDLYLSKLEFLGYKYHTSNTVGDNYFASYYNDKYVIHAGYYAYEKSVRITIEEKTALVPLEPENIYSRKDGIKTSLAQIGLATEEGDFRYNGMAYIFQLADGSFMVIDGGFASDAARIYKYLKFKSGGGDIVIASWIITHNDADHRECFSVFASRYGGEVRIEQLVLNFPNADVYSESGTQENSAVAAAAKSVKDLRIIKAHTGQKFYIRNAVVEILYSLDSYLPLPLKIFNNSSLVFTVDIEGERILFMGDASDEVSRILVNMFGGYLRCDMLQLAHHGIRNFHGLNMPYTEAAYALMRSEIVLWPTSVQLYTNIYGSADPGGIAQLPWNLVALQSAREVFVAGGDYATVLELPYGIFTSELITFASMGED